MKTYTTILQGHEATEENAINFAICFDFSEEETEEIQKDIHRHNYIDTLKGVEIWYNIGADYYFFVQE